jgi:uncharacterized protein YndB with AHSA1/START domain
MTVRSVIHDSFVVERTYPATPSRVFAAFSSEEAKNWGETGDLEPAEEDQAGPTEFDFRVGGRERFGHKMHDTTFRLLARASFHVVQLDRSQDTDVAEPNGNDYADAVQLDRSDYTEVR